MKVLTRNASFSHDFKYTVIQVEMEKLVIESSTELNNIMATIGHDDLAEYIQGDQIPCQSCDGNDSTCRTCNGRGYVTCHVTYC